MFRLLQLLAAETECGSKAPYAYEEDGNARCLTREQCYKCGFILDSRCVSAATCTKEKRYAYQNTGECSTDEPDADGHFDEKALKENNVYACPDATYVLDLTGEKRRCIEWSTCLYVIKGIRLYYKQENCITREVWLAKDPKNFVSVCFRAETYWGEFPLTAEKVCGNNDTNGQYRQPESGVAFVADRICGCPANNLDTKFVDIESNTCVKGWPEEYNG